MPTYEERFDKVEVGDLVDCRVSDDMKLPNLLVLYVPLIPGEAWRFRTEYGILLYVQHYQTMVLRAKCICARRGQRQDVVVL